MNHLWQSTLCAAVAWLLTLALRKNRAAVRYWIWLAASVKFLIPFSLLVSAGNQFEWRAAPSIAPSQFSFVMDQMTQPFASPALSSPVPIPATPPNFVPILFTVWFGGIAIGVFVWIRSWLRVHAALRAARPLGVRLPIPVLSSATRLEPGVFGIVRPVLLLPEGIADHLSPEQLEAVLAHELCHVRRLDNLTAAVHMVVETVFWFHPLVWWIGKRLADERERACDEEVLQLGSEPYVYAESILRVCKFYLQSPLDCVSGITGSDLRKRIRGIMTNRVSQKLTAGRKLLLAAAGLADRFKLKFHIETKEMPVYSLVVAKNGLKIKEANDDGNGTQIDGDPQHPLSARNISMAGFAGTLSRLQELDRPVIDATGLKGIFNFTLDYSPGDAAPSDNTGPSIFTALTEQLGLKLEAGKGPVDVYVVDHVERPSDNNQAFFRKAMYSPQTFEVASVKPAGPGDGGMKSVEGRGFFGLEHRRLDVRLNLYGLIVNAYSLRGCPPIGENGGCNLLSGGPDWLRKDQFEIAAKVPDNAPDYTSTQFVNQHAPQVQLMLQALLAERFALKVHRETKELPVFALTIGKKGPKLKKSDGSKEPKLFFRAVSAPDGTRMIRLTVENGSMQELVELYSKFLDRPLIDKTGLQDRYDFTVEYEANPEAPGPFWATYRPRAVQGF